MNREKRKSFLIAKIRKLLIVTIFIHNVIMEWASNMFLSSNKLKSIESNESISFPSAETHACTFWRNLVTIVSEYWADFAHLFDIKYRQRKTSLNIYDCLWQCIGFYCLLLSSGTELIHKISNMTKSTNVPEIQGHWKADLNSLIYNRFLWLLLFRFPWRRNN